MKRTVIYRDRADAGRALASALAEQRWSPDTLVLGLPRGGVPVAFGVAQRLHLPLELYLVRKLGAPENPELAIGAIASGGVRVLNRELIEQLGVTPEELRKITAAEQRELARRERDYRGDRPVPDFESVPVIIVDDGLATGFTVRAAILALRQDGCPRIAVAAPVGPEETCASLARQADLVVCPCRPEPFLGVGQWYEDFSPTSDEEVRECLRRAEASGPPIAGQRSGGGA